MTAHSHIDGLRAARPGPLASGAMGGRERLGGRLRRHVGRGRKRRRFLLRRRHWRACRRRNEEEHGDADEHRDGERNDEDPDPTAPWGTLHANASRISARASRKRSAGTVRECRRHRRRERWRHATDERRRIGSEDRFDARVLGPWPLRREHLVEHGPDRVEVGARVDGSARDLFGRKISGAFRGSRRSWCSGSPCPSPWRSRRSSTFTPSRRIITLPGFRSR